MYPLGISEPAVNLAVFVFIFFENQECLENFVKENYLIRIEGTRFNKLVEYEAKLVKVIFDIRKYIPDEKARDKKVNGMLKIDITNFPNMAIGGFKPEFLKIIGAPEGDVELPINFFFRQGHTLGLVELTN